MRQTRFSKIFKLKVSMPKECSTPRRNPSLRFYSIRCLDDIGNTMEKTNICDTCPRLIHKM